MFPSSYHPVFLDLAGRKVLVVGGGPIAVEKLQSILHARAVITVVAPEAVSEIKLWHGQGLLTWVQRAFLDSDIADSFIVYGATQDPQVNSRVSALAQSMNRLANAVDDPSHCNFISPAIGRQGPVQVAVTSAGCSPALAQRLRNRIMREIVTEEVGTLAELLGSWRSEVKKVLPTYQDRKRFWELVLDSDVPSLMAQGAEGPASRLIDELLRTSSLPDPGTVARTCGTVYLVGAGPGDPRLLTLWASELLARADVVMYDRLVPQEMLGMAKPDAELIYVGKLVGTPGEERQVEINRLLIAHAREGRMVVRLKGGDPFVFGRGGEEALALAEAGVPYEVVPGVSSVNAAAAMAKVPLTHRHVSASYGVFAGHPSDDEPDSIPWDAAASVGTAVFLMGAERVGFIASQLIAHGRPADTPVAIVSNATTREQSIVTGRLDEYAERPSPIRSPAVIIVGPVASLFLAPDAKHMQPSAMTSVC